MSRAICPALKRRDTDFICEYSGKTINPFAWYCLFDYYTCPVYVSYIKEERKIERKIEVKAEIKPLTEEKIEELTKIEEKVERKIELVEVKRVKEITEPEDKIIEYISSTLSKVEEGVKDLDLRWRDYENAVNNVRQSWEKDKALLTQYLSIIEKVISRYNLDLKEVEFRRNSGIVDEITYSKLKDSIGKRLEKISNKYSELKEKYLEINDNLYQHVKRIIITTPTPEVSKVRISLARLEDMYREGRIGKGAYDKLKNELEKLLGGFT